MSLSVYAYDFPVLSRPAHPSTLLRTLPYFRVLSSSEQLCPHLSETLKVLVFSRHVWQIVYPRREHISVQILISWGSEQFSLQLSIHIKASKMR